MITYLLVIVVVRSGENLSQGTGEAVNFLNISETVFRALPIITLAYTCQMNLFPLLSTLKVPTRRNVRRVIYGSIVRLCVSVCVSVCVCVCGCVGVCGCGCVSLLPLIVPSKSFPSVVLTRGFAWQARYHCAW